MYSSVRPILAATLAFVDLDTLALGAAFEAGILHRDVSFNNIMITKDGEVIVNDWDHAGKAKLNPEECRKAFRTVSP